MTFLTSNRINAMLLLIIAVTFISCSDNNKVDYNPTPEQGSYPKYIFYFIGDGMGTEHIKLAYNSPTFTYFPYQGFLSTNNFDNTTTDSAAAGTALATGSKTKNSVLGLASDKTTKLENIMEVAKSLGYATGIVTTVSIDHATPGSFYAHVQSRNSYNEIASWIPFTGLTLYAGGGFLDPKDLFAVFEEDGYKIVRGTNVNLDSEKIIWIQDETANPAHLPYAVSRRPQDLTLPIIIEKSMKFLYDKGGDKGFVLVAEGGMIDFASHSNNDIQAKGEVEDLANAVDVALQFYKQYPAQTLIIVTADHETGGLYFNNTNQPKWKTTGHTSAKVPIYAIGAGAENFMGSMANNEVALKIKTILRNIVVQFTNH